VHGFHGGDRLTAGVFHQNERGDTDLFDRAAISFPHLRTIEDSHLHRRILPLKMAATVNVNGRVFDQEHAGISGFDHGFLYGEGVYEPLRTYNGQPFLFDRHMRRLRNSADMLALGVPLTDAEVDARFRETMRAAGLGDGRGEAYLRILVTRGIGELTYEPSACPNPSIVVIVKPHVSPPAEVFDRGVKVALVPIVRNHPGSVHPLIKSD